MNRTFCYCKYVVSWFICALVFDFSASSFGQTALPPLESVNVANFTIPFGVGESANAIREVELLVSKDRGKRWYSVAKQPVESGKFAFRADSDGEYWFSFRTIMTNGNAAPFNGYPLLRVMVNTEKEIVVLPSHASESGPLTPPKPERFRGENVPPKPQPVPAANDEEPEPRTDEPLTLPVLHEVEVAPPILAPRLPGFEQPEQGKKETRNLLDELLSGMSPFMDVRPVEVARIASSNAVVPAPSPALQPVDSPAGGITDIALSNVATKPQVVVRWNPGSEFWQDAQIDILRSGTKGGPWSPIAINLSNSGEYWWFLTPEDFKPFHVAVRIRSFNGGTHTDVTHTAITIDPKMSMFHGGRSKE